MFDFYLKVYRTGLITFCGVDVKVDFDVNGSDGKFGFREYDNGRFKNMTPISRHSNILKGVIIGKKGWGLWVSQWTDGIVDWTFTKEEILQEFIERNIIIPESLMLEWDKLIQKKKQIRNEQYYNNYKSISKVIEVNQGCEGKEGKRFRGNKGQLAFVFPEEIE